LLHKTGSCRRAMAQWVARCIFIWAYSAHGLWFSLYPSTIESA
jgi:hypothetical protein